MDLFRFNHYKEGMIRNVIKKCIQLRIHHGNQAFYSRKHPFIFDALYEISRFSNRHIHHGSVLSDLPEE